MGKIIIIDFDAKQKDSDFCNEDAYRDGVLEALSALQSGDIKKAEQNLIELLGDVEQVMAGKSL
jgi:hypothetical protein